MRRVVHALLVSVGAMILLVGTSLAVPIEEVSVQTRALQGGDVAAYSVTYEGDWRYEHHTEGEPSQGPRFQVLPPEGVRGSDGRLIQAHPVLWHSEGTTLHPGDTWYDSELRRWWLEGDVVATEQVKHQVRGVLAEMHRSVTYDAHRDCLLSGPGSSHTTPGCTLPGMRVSLPPGPLVASQVVEQGLRLKHIHAPGSITMDWWYAADIPVPVTYKFTALGPAQEPRTATYHLTGFQHGQAGQAPQPSAIVAPPIHRAPMETWGLLDTGIDHPFRLSQAFDEAVRHNTFAGLRDWLRYHPQGYVFRADYQQQADGSETRHSWELHLSDGREGYSVRISQNEGEVLPLSGVRVQPIETSSLAPAAPPRHLVGHVPTVASVWERWGQHVTAQERHAGANAWSFEILTDRNGDPVVRVAGGHTQNLRWGPAGLPVVDLAHGEEATLITLDGQGETQRFERRSTGPVQSMPAPAAAEPLTVAGYAATGWALPSTGHGARMGIAASLLGLAYLGWPTLKAAGLALFSRLRPDELLEDPTRATIMDALEADPGLHFRALCERLGANPGRIRHHLHKLQQAGLIRARQSPGYTCYFPAATCRAVLDAGPLLRSEGARHILAALRQTPGARSKDLASAAGLSAATATYHLKRLQDAGLVAAQRDGRSVRMRLTPGGQQATQGLGIA